VHSVLKVSNDDPKTPSLFQRQGTHIRNQKPRRRGIEIGNLGSPIVRGDGFAKSSTSRFGMALN
jgi:hypothetical protein